VKADAFRRLSLPATAARWVFLSPLPQGGFGPHQGAAKASRFREPVLLAVAQVVVHAALGNTEEFGGFSRRQVPVHTQQSRGSLNPSELG
jgi:hypothetical protein